MAQEIDIAQKYVPHWKQALVHESKKKIRVLKWSRRGGKGRCAVFQFIKWFAEILGEERAASLVPKILFWIVAPTYGEAAQAWLEVKAFWPKEFTQYRGNHPYIIEDEKIIHCVGGGMVQVKSADNPESLQNVGLDAVWITEASYQPEVVWHKKVRPMLRSPGRKGYAIIESTPNLDDCWFERLYQRGQDPDDPEVESWHLTFWENPFLDHEAILREAEDMPEAVFRQQYMAETLSDTSAAFLKWESCIAGTLEEPEEGKSYCIGVDLGKQIDFTVLTVMDRAKRQVVGFHRMGKIDWVSQKETIISWAKKWKNALLILDATGVGDPIYDDLVRSGVQIRPVKMRSLPEKYALMVKLIVAIENGYVKYPRIPELITELKMCRRIAVSKQGDALKIDKIQAPKGFHDDCVVSLALGYSACYAPGNYEPIKPKRYMQPWGGSTYG